MAELKIIGSKFVEDLQRSSMMNSKKLKSMFSNEITDIHNIYCVKDKQDIPYAINMILDLLENNPTNFVRICSKFTPTAYHKFYGGIGIWCRAVNAQDRIQHGSTYSCASLDTFRKCVRLRTKGLLCDQCQTFTDANDWKRKFCDSCTNSTIFLYPLYNFGHPTTYNWNLMSAEEEKYEIAACKHCTANSICFAHMAYSDSDSDNEQNQDITTDLPAEWVLS